MSETTNRNREKGHRFERKTRKLLSFVFPEIKTSRNESKELDNKGVDFTKTDPFNFQCKSWSKKVDYVEIISKMEKVEGIPVILHQLTEKRGSRFYVVEEYAILKMVDFMNLIGIKNV
jgi:hypothetical protein